jgi:hypothetical protein
MYRPSESGYLYVVDRVTQYLYKLRQSDRAIVAKWYLGGSLTNQPIGLSGDPTDSAHFYVLDAHLPGSGHLHELQGPQVRLQRAEPSSRRRACPTASGRT